MTRKQWKGGVSRREFLASIAAMGAGAVILNASELEARAASGGVLRIAQPSDPEPNSIFAGGSGNVTWRDQVFETLTSLDPETREPRKVLATDWEASEDGKTFVVRIRDDVRFHTGRPMTAEDVVFTLRQMTDPRNRSLAQTIVESFTSIEATGDYELTITSDTPFVTRIFDVFQLAAIVDHETFGGVADGSRMVGTGPFVWDNWSPGARLTLLRNQDYWQPDRPLLDAIEVSVISDATALSNAPRGGGHIAFALPARDTISYERDPNFEVVIFPNGPFLLLGMDVTKPPFDNKLARQALGYAVDRQRIVDQILNGYGSPSTLYWPQSEPGMTEELANRYHYDPDRARSMLEEARAAGSDITITVMGLPNVIAMYEIIQFDLRAVGMNVIANVLPPPEYSRRIAVGDVGQAFVGLQGTLGFSGATIVDSLPTLRAGNPSKFDTERYAELKLATQSASPSEYGERLAELLDYMLEEAFMHSLVRLVSQNVVATSVQDMDFSATNFLRLGNTWLQG